LSKSQSRALILAVVFVVLSLVALLLQLGQSLPGENLLLRVLTPVQGALQRASRGLGGLWPDLRDASKLRAENEALRAENERLKARIVGLQEVAIENQSLREQLGFKQTNPTYDLLPAQVIGRDPSNFLRFLFINKGSNDGVHEGAVVVAQESLLVGRVVRVGANYAQVMLISDASSSVNGLIQSSRAEGVVNGQLTGRLVMRYIPQGELVQKGDIVLTSGLGGNFPKDLIIGQVTAVRQRDIELFQEADVAPAVNLGKLEIVFVIRDFAPTYLE
jgi:rod shape-determining protein MreC